jgi:hypothetical protein
LTQKTSPGRSCDVFFLQQREKSAQQVEVSLAYMLWVHGSDYNNALDKYVGGRADCRERTRDSTPMSGRSVDG